MRHTSGAGDYGSGVTPAVTGCSALAFWLDCSPVGGLPHTVRWWTTRRPRSSCTADRLTAGWWRWIPTIRIPGSRSTATTGAIPAAGPSMSPTHPVGGAGSGISGRRRSEPGDTARLDQLPVQRPACQLAVVAAGLWSARAVRLGAVHPWYLCHMASLARRGAHQRDRAA